MGHGRSLAPAKMVPTGAASLGIGHFLARGSLRRLAERCNLDIARFGSARHAECKARLSGDGELLGIAASMVAAELVPTDGLSMGVVSVLVRGKGLTGREVLGLRSELGPVKRLREGGGYVGIAAAMALAQSVRRGACFLGIGR